MNTKLYWDNNWDIYSKITGNTISSYRKGYKKFKSECMYNFKVCEYIYPDEIKQ